jgi:predicted transcriptional regulator YdeE
LFADIWKTFESCRQQIEPLTTGQIYYGVSFPTAEKHLIEYLAGMPVADETRSPRKLEVRTIPGGQFAVFECPVQAIGATYQYIFTVWLPSAAFQLDAALPSFEEYPESTSDQPVCIHIPVRQGHAGGEHAG